jgi:hypothetical protein
MNDQYVFRLMALLLFIYNSYFSLSTLYEGELAWLSYFGSESVRSRADSLGKWSIA